MEATDSKGPKGPQGPREDPISTISEALGRAYRLAQPYGEFGDAGEPLDADAEVTALILEAETAVGLLQERAERAAIEACKEHLFYDAARGFEYDGADDEMWGNYLEGCFDGAVRAAEKIGLPVHREAVVEKGTHELVGELRGRMPSLKHHALEPLPIAITLRDLSKEERERVRISGDADREYRDNARVLRAIARAEHDKRIRQREAPQEEGA